MNGRTHAVSGAALWLTMSPLLSILPGMHVGEIALGAVATAGAAMLPDLDHPQATVSRTFGWPTRVLSRWISHVSGGHRHGTHTVMFVVVASAVSATITALGLAGSLVTLSLGLGVRALGWTRSGAVANLSTFVVCAGATWTAHHVGISFAWIPVAYLLGTSAHVLGDAFTVQGVRPWKPIHKGWVRLGRVSTNGWTERVLITPGLSVLAVAIPAAYVMVGWM